MPVLLPTGEASDGTPTHQVLRQTLQYVARNALLGATAITALTNSTGGTADAAATGRRIFRPALAVGGPDGGSTLADKTTTEAALVAALDGTREVIAKANAMATRLGLPNLIYNGGGAAPDDTMAAISNSVTGAVTGCDVASYNAVVQALAAAQLTIAAQVQTIARACGQTEPRSGTAGWLVNFPVAASPIAGTLFGSWPVQGLTRASNVVTVVTTRPHGLLPGQGVVIAGAADSGFNGNFVVASVISNVSFTFAQTAANATSTGGTATPAIAALSTNTGTAASPGVFKTEADVALTVLRNNLVTLATVLNACRVQGTPIWVAA